MAKDMTFIFYRKWRFKSRCYYEQIKKFDSHYTMVREILCYCGGTTFALKLPPEGVEKPGVSLM